jgi:hypothetical protein
MLAIVQFQVTNVPRHLNFQGVKLHLVLGEYTEVMHDTRGVV